VLPVPSRAHIADSRTDAQAIASAINLTAADIKGFTDEGAPAIANLRSAERQQARCGGTLPLLRKRLAFLVSHRFQQEPTQTSLRIALSEVWVFPTEKLAMAQLAALGSKRVPKCGVPVVRKAFGPKFKGLRIRMHRIQSAVAGGVGWRITELSGPGLPRRQFIDLFAFARGRVMVALSTTSSPDLFPQDLEGQLMTLLATRASPPGP
jgi:hypothetical protein